jgi:hypothetical protein
MVPKSNNSKMYRGTFKGNLINLDHKDILRYYNSIIIGFYNNYQIVTNMNKLANIIWLLKESCGLTLARKYKLKTLKEVFTKFGKNLGVNNYELWVPKSYKRVRITKWVNSKEIASPKWVNSKEITSPN